MNDKLKKFAKGKLETKDEVGGNCIIYNRVSSKEQLDGQSLETQMEKCVQYAEKLCMTITEKFGGTFESAKSDRERKEFNRMLDFLKKSKKPINAVIVYSTSRFSRTGSTTIIEEVEKIGAQVLSATSNYNPKTAQGKFIQNMELATARLDNDIKRATTIDNSIAALRKGRWIAKAPRGYDQKTTKKEQIIIINKEGDIIRQAFEWKANQNLTNEEIILKLKAIGFVICKQKLSELFKNPFYCGLMTHNFLNGELIRGNHPALVSEEVFLKANGILNKAHSNGYEVKLDKPEVPLMGTIKCPHCGRNMTSAISTKMKKKYDREIYYYVCWNKGCKQNNSAKIVHESFEKTINGYGLPNDLTNLLIAQMNMTFAYMNQESAEQSFLLKNRLTKIEKDIKQVEDNWVFATEQRQIDICKRKLKELDNEKVLIENELHKVENISLNLPKYIEYGIKLKNNLFNIWQLAELGEKKKLQNLVYPQGVIFNKQMGLIEPISVNRFIALNAYESTRNTTNKKRTTSRNDQLSPFVQHLGH